MATLQTIRNRGVLLAIIIGLALLAVSGSIVAAPVALPAVVVTVAGYAAVAGGVLSAVSQITVDTSTSSVWQTKKI